MEYRYQSEEELPCYMNADQLGAFLGISRASAYTLMHMEGFPTTRIGKRLMVSSKRLLEWLEEQTEK